MTIMFNKKIETAINDQINAELWSAYLYLSMSAYCYDNGYNGVANWYQVQFKEEQDHAMILFNYIIWLLVPVPPRLYSSSKPSFRQLPAVQTSSVVFRLYPYPLPESGCDRVHSRAIVVLPDRDGRASCRERV